MDVGDVQRLVARVAAVDVACGDRLALESAVGELRCLKSWVESREVTLARALRAVSSFPEKNLADAARSNLREAERVMRRAEVVEVVPVFEESLDAGRVSGEHVDALDRVLRNLDPHGRQKLTDQAPRLVRLAETSSAEDFAKTLRREARRLDNEAAPEERLRRQKTQVRLNSWIDRESGMGRWAATWDPETMVRLENRLDAQVEALFRDTVPEGCPIDLLEKQAFLRARALLAIIDGNGVRLGRPEIVVVVDHTQPNPDGTPTIDWDLPVDLPKRVLDHLARRAVTHTVVVRNGVIVSAPGRLNQGRHTRLANRDQRRALHALYPSCAIPGCRVRYARTRLHHVRFWRNMGLTDLENLLPVCEHHHDLIHNDGWLLSLGPDRTLSITFPDGQVMTTGPPRRNAA